MIRGPETSGRLLVILVVALIAMAALQVWRLLRVEPLGMDFLPLWTAGRMAWTEPGKVYDFAAVTAAQAWLSQPHFSWLRPYAFPPTTLLLMAPLGRLPFWAADVAWTALSLGVFVIAAARLAERTMLLAALLAAALPATVVAATAGQPVVLAAGLIVLAVLELDRRPRLAGLLLVVAAIAKPEAAIMAPIALLACGAFEALVSAGVVVVVAMAASAVLFGPGRWGEWLESLPAFQRVVEGIPGLGSAVITPLWAARELGLAGVWPTVVATVFALAGAWLTWTVFRSSADPVRRVGVLAAGSLLAAPYALWFDATLIAPAAVALVIGALGQGRAAVPLLALAATFEIASPYLGLPSALVLAALVMIEWPARRSPASELRYQATTP